MESAGVLQWVFGPCLWHLDEYSASGSTSRQGTREKECTKRDRAAKRQQRSRFNRTLRNRSAYGYAVGIDIHTFRAVTLTRAATFRSFVLIVPH